MVNSSTGIFQSISFPAAPKRYQNTKKYEKEKKRRFSLLMTFVSSSYVILSFSTIDCDVEMRHESKEKMRNTVESWESESVKRVKGNKRMWNVMNF